MLRRGKSVGRDEVCGWMNRPRGDTGDGTAQSLEASKYVHKGWWGRKSQKSSRR